MKLIIEENQNQKHTEIIIKCSHIDKKIQNLINQIHNCTFSIKGKKDNNIYQITLEEILYFECVDENVFIYTFDNVYKSDKKLYELESLLKNTKFLRISKSCIVNLNYLINVRPLFDGKFIIKLKNNEELVINRHYVKIFKEAFDI